MSSRSTLPLALLAALVLTACSQGSTDSKPAMVITSPANGAVLNGHEGVVLSANALDAKDGDLGDEVEWSSNRDGALTPDPEGRVTLTPGSHVIRATVTNSGGASSTASVNVTVEAPSATHLVGSGASLYLVSLHRDEIWSVDSAAAPTDGLLPSHTVFNAIFHPTEPWLYVASFDREWGNARIDRFVVGPNSVEHAGAAFVYEYQLPGIACTDDMGDKGQIGNCAPIGMVFSPDGSRLYVDDDGWDVLQIFAVAADGSLEFIVEGAGTSVHGLTIDPTGTYLYNGTNVIDVTGDLPTDVHTDTGGNSTTLVDLAGTPGLITTVGTYAIGIYDLTDPTNPVEVAYFDAGGSVARELAFDSSLEHIYAAGQNTVSSFTFDGADITELDAYLPIDVAPIQYRDVAIGAEGDRLLASWFHGGGGSGVDLFDVADDGSLTSIYRYELHDGFGHLVIAWPDF